MLTNVMLIKKKHVIGLEDQQIPCEIKTFPQILLSGNFSGPKRQDKKRI